MKSHMIIFSSIQFSKELLRTYYMLRILIGSRAITIDKQQIQALKLKD